MSTAHAVPRRDVLSGRLNLLLDKGSFVELAGLAAGAGTIAGRRVFVHVQDSALDGAPVNRVADLAAATGAPLIGLLGNGPTLRLPASRVPTIGVVLDPGPAPALSDLVLAVRGSGAEHAETLFDDEATCLSGVRRLVRFLPPSPPAPVHPDDRPGLRGLVPPDPAVPYDMRAVLAELVDGGEHVELHAHWAGTVICALARVGGRLVGVAANQPAVLGGALGAAAVRKVARFIRFCDTFEVPLVSLVDGPAFRRESGDGPEAALRHRAQLLSAFCESTVPRVQVVVRTAPGAALAVTDFGADLALVWPADEPATTRAAIARELTARLGVER